mmetsp:Transcript_3522/g.6691  ORF Transcript_3522/g.6691 Transcript_3522/m.6691 type:complete len:335 (-) Transcript_3522:91-1095(-)
MEVSWHLILPVLVRARRPRLGARAAKRPTRSCKVEAAKAQQFDRLSDVLPRILEIGLQHIHHGVLLAAERIFQRRLERRLLLGGIDFACGVRVGRQKRRSTELLLEQLHGALRVLLGRLHVLQQDGKPCTIHEDKEPIFGPRDGVGCATMPGQKGTDGEARQRTLRSLSLLRCWRLWKGQGHDLLLSAWLSPILTFLPQVISAVIHGCCVDDFGRGTLASEDGEEGIRFLQVSEDLNCLLWLALRQAKLQQQEANLDGKKVVDGLDVVEELLQDQSGLRVLPELDTQEGLVVPQDAEVLVLAVGLLIVLIFLATALVLLIALTCTIVRLGELSE